MPASWSQDKADASVLPLGVVHSGHYVTTSPLDRRTLGIPERNRATPWGRR